MMAAKPQLVYANKGEKAVSITSGCAPGGIERFYVRPSVDCILRFVALARHRKDYEVVSSLLDVAAAIFATPLANWKRTTYLCRRLNALY